MKKVSFIFSVIVVAAMALLLAACTGSPAASNSTQANTPSYEELQAQLEAVTQERDSLKAELESLKKNDEAEKAATTVQENDVTVSVIDKTNTPEDPDQWIFNNYVNLVFSIQNNTDKDIQGIQGNLTVKDLFGEEILTVGCDFTGETIAAGSSITNDDLSYECNQFMDQDMKFFNESYEDLQFDYAVTQIVFTDGTVKES